MSLFGTSPTEATAKSKNSLFDDDSTQPGKPGSGLFADESADPDVWTFPTPKKQARSNLVKTLLPAAEVPDSYIDAFDALLRAGERTGTGVSLAGVTKLLSGTALSSDEQAHILKIVIPNSSDVASTGIDRGQFNVLLALVGLAQEKEEVSLDGVDERRRRLPQPSLASVDSKTLPRQETSLPAKEPSAPQNEPSSPTRNRARKQSFGVPDTDPWGSPGQRTNYGYGTTPHSNGVSGNNPNSSLLRTTSNITTSAEQPSSRGHLSATAEPSSGGGNDWGGTYSSTSANIFSGSGIGEDYGASGGDEGGNGPSNRLNRSIGPNRHSSRGVDETVTVTALPEKEGMFLFQYRNYQVSSARRGSTVIRRYSDFVWLLDCLHKRYPFRQLPLLPPKRVAINGNHIAADTLFIEKRRRGLARFANALVRHPVLNSEQLVVMFLTVPTELGVWRKQATIQVQEEFTGKTLPPHLEDSLPPTLEQTFDTVRNGIRRSADIYISLCVLLERLIKRKEGIAADYMRLATSLHTLSEASAETYHIDTNDVPLLNEGINASAKHISTNQSLLEDESRAWDEGVLEDLKRQRDGLVGMRDMFDRRDRFARDTIPALEKRIGTNESKLSAVRAKPEGTRKPGEAEKLEEAIMKDKQSIVDQHARGVLIKECVRDEIVNFQSTQYHVSRLCQDWSQERVKYAELLADNWRALQEEIEGMPLGESGT